MPGGIAGRRTGGQSCSARNLLNEIALQSRKHLKCVRRTPHRHETMCDIMGRSMAEMLGGTALECYDSVFAHETEQTKHITQDFTPKLAAPVVPKIYVQ